jgi:hypothetical protein
MPDSQFLAVEGNLMELVDFWVPRSSNSGCLQNQASGNEAHEKCFYYMSCLMAVMFHVPSFMGYFKCKVFISKPRTSEELKQRIKEEIAAILKQMTRRVMENHRGGL